ncbi:NifB/NifX family molybdenum-iron cluster-binding protein [Coleofasciculus sp.]|jgi:predicted Fe-Mo cluster-binding NifX family protein|uniref:NifB/NifX family molybdenum-iron cluster-binding protein n=1 Tax=Coleofasciculus sp. TaxID=3100458 RepID=UPI003A400AF1
MKIAISSTGNTLDAPLDPRFGRCAYLILIDSQTGEFTALPNAAASQSGGAGVQSATKVVEQGAQVVISGSFGPKATQTLEAGGVQIHTSTAATVRLAVEQWQQSS